MYASHWPGGVDRVLTLPHSVQVVCQLTDEGVEEI